MHQSCVWESQQTSCHKRLEEVTPNVSYPEVCESSKLVSRKAGFDNVHASGPFQVYEGSCFVGFVSKATHQGLRYSHQHILLVIAYSVARSDSVYPKLTNMNKTVCGFTISLL